MSLWNMVATVLIGPLKLLFELIFNTANTIMGNPVLAIIALSLSMNVLVLPLYRRADAMQLEARDNEEKLSRWVGHIKKTFKGDERMMILQTYYRQNNYSPLQAINGSVSLLLEIPFFLAAYQFLLGLSVFSGVSLGPISDLSMPDGMIAVGGVTINALPFVMTFINCISSAIYLKGFPLKSQVQLYAMALFFLVFLYNSPACLLIYWTLNNLFSLLKNIVYKLKKPKLFVSVAAAILGVAVIGYAFYSAGSVLGASKIMCVLGVALLLPLAMYVLKPNFGKLKLSALPDRKLFLASAAFLTILLGVLIPSAVIADSPLEFISVARMSNPLSYVLNALCYSVGTFFVWLGVFYWLASPNGKLVIERLAAMGCGMALINYMLFKVSAGNLSPMLQYERPLSASGKLIIINLAVMAAIAVTIWLLSGRFHNKFRSVLLVGALAIGIMSGINCVGVKKASDDWKLSQDKVSDSAMNYRLSRAGKNVVLIMLDRAMGIYNPYIFNEIPELVEQFDGFTYYSNVLSFSGCTNLAAPALYGGYEYTPVEINRRNSEELSVKEQEALKVLPVLFSENGFETTVTDPVTASSNLPYAPAIYDDYPNINSFDTDGKFPGSDKVEECNRRNFFCYSVMRVAPTLLQPMLYNGGWYNSINLALGTIQVTNGTSMADGIDSSFIESYNVLLNLSSMTQITDEASDTYLSLYNLTTHQPMLLSEPDYAPAEHVDNREYDAANAWRFSYEGVTLDMSTSLQMSHYQCNMASMLELGKWFDYLRENGVYDNTRIIIVADHGRDLHHVPDMMKKESGVNLDIENFYPLLMVKDFDSHGYTVSEEFMTNADVPTLLTEGLIASPVNPFTGKEINSDAKTAHRQFVSLTSDWTQTEGTTYSPSKWASVETDVREVSNWQVYEQVTALTEHAEP